MFHIKFVGMFMIYLQTKFHIIKLQAEYAFNMATMFLLCIIQEYDMKKKSCIFFGDIHQKKSFMAPS